MSRARRILPLLVVGWALLGAILLMQALMPHVVDGCQDALPVAGASDLSSDPAVAASLPARLGDLSGVATTAGQGTEGDGHSNDVCLCGASCESALAPAPSPGLLAGLMVALALVAIWTAAELLSRPDPAGRRGRQEQRGPPGRAALLITLCVART